jgi:5'-methylthioadenosine phosphorylase
MTNMPEAKLAREAELCYAPLALVTDYDCWHETEEAVTVEAVLGTLYRNVTLAKQIIRAVVPSFADPMDCPCHRALDNAILTAPNRISPAVRKKLAVLIDRALTSKKGIS